MSCRMMCKDGYTSSFGDETREVRKEELVVMNRNVVGNVNGLHVAATIYKICALQKKLNNTDLCHDPLRHVNIRSITEVLKAESVLTLHRAVMKKSHHNSESCFKRKQQRLTVHEKAVSDLNVGEVIQIHASGNVERATIRDLNEFVRCTDYFRGSVVFIRMAKKSNVLPCSSYSILGSTANVTAKF